MMGVSESIAELHKQVTHIEDEEQYKQARAWFIQFQDDETPEAMALKEDLIYYMEDYEKNS